MSDTCYSSVSRMKYNVPINIIDETWAEEVLSDDEINIPKELEYNEDDIEKDLEDDSSDGGSEESWSDSGMDQFTQEIR